MIRLYVFCEGQSEESFTKEVLYAHLHSRGVSCVPILFSTRERHKGGIVTYGKIRRQILRQCQHDPRAHVTTFMDFYRLPRDFPEFDRNRLDAVDAIRCAEAAFQRDIDSAMSHRNFIANIIAHEFEALLFSSPPAFAHLPDQGELVTLLSAIRDAFPTPEYIDDGPDTTPSKRILNLYPQYEKVVHGTLVALDIGLAAIRNECPKFDAWLTSLESLTSRTDKRSPKI